MTDSDGQRKSFRISYEPGHSIYYRIACAPSEDSDQPAHLRRLIRVFAGHPVGNQGFKAHSSGQRRLGSASVNAQADLSFRWALMQSCRKCCFPAHL